MHADWPCEGCAAPGLQVWHADSPAIPANVPPTQFVHAAELICPVSD